jgi:hypothetical protein
VPVSQRNIGRRAVSFLYHFSDIVRFDPWIENPRVGGSIPPLATTQIRNLTSRIASPAAGDAFILSTSTADEAAINSTHIYVEMRSFLE